MNFLTNAIVDTVWAAEFNQWHLNWFPLFLSHLNGSTNDTKGNLFNYHNEFNLAFADILWNI